ncbi:MAG: deoxyhypusine synthase [Thaumarchaeota archaeon]|jgi:deoxyhypusine synthase|nr:deoxyhypusine synthase [Candidatus Geocrenenecus arthurdayi]MCL7390727.1 deoxyhypusine synthase [Candidatus Geocrenenecus arthurdayi]MCL7395817.1 deoxyhypusine synthase [Candidatus Geocrenenecus arthurdayi]MCL7402065.1 deoxyhypusine synthase [Candidatus Geocrenenecus arthurdayi]MCL7402914.1 deoxyhypusine synthase [Candidatus Geocrenenecus arthurdayi]
MLRVVKDIKIKPGMTVSELIEMMGGSGGFTALYVARAVEVLEKMIKDNDCIKFLSFIGAPIGTGLRGVISELIRRRLFNIVITTCGALDHDIARSLKEYYEGDFWMDDETLKKQGYHRLGCVLIPLENYGPTIEKFTQELLEEEYNKGLREVCSSDITYLIGLKLKDENSFLKNAAENNIPVFVPGILDGAVGTQIWLFQQKHRDFKLNLLRDFDKLSDVIFKAKRSGALMIGGGISKHHVLWWNQFKDGLDYAVYITTGYEYDGSLSGATVREAVSWGKVKPEAMKVTVHGDATIILPLIASALIKLE